MSALLACAVVLAACSSEPKPVYQEQPAPQAVVTEYDASLEPSAAVLALVPEEAATLRVTDFDQLRLVLGFATLDGKSPAAESDRFWRQVPRTAALSEGLLRGSDAELRDRFGISQDDVAWEASYDGGADGADGWVLALHDDVSMDAVRRAVRAGVGPLAGAVVDPDRRLVTSQDPPEVTASWGADEGLVALSGREAVATWFERACTPFDTVFGAGMQDQLAAVPAKTLENLDDLDAYAVALGTELVTVQLGEDRADAFARLRLAEVMPETSPDFGLVMNRGVADPSTGRLGYTLADPAAAARMTLTGRLPFAVCPG